MRKILTALTLLVVCLTTWSCFREDGLTPTAVQPEVSSTLVRGINAESVAWDIVRAAQWEIDPEGGRDGEPWSATKSDGGSRVIACERIPLIDDIVHYRFEVRVGTGTYEKVRLHRVVRERRPNLPIRARAEVFALHGTPGDFEIVYLFGAVAPNVPDDLAIAIYLARNDVDVWGIDQSNTFVPLQEADLSFMSEWDLQYDIDNLRIGLAIVRFTRLLTGSGFGKLTLLGYSTGARTGYATLSHEAQLPDWQRHIGAFIPVDIAFKTDDEQLSALACGSAAAIAAQIAAGGYASTDGRLALTLAALARTDPTGPSPVVPGLNNEQALLFVGAVTGAITGTPNFHFWAGVFGPGGIPSGYQYTDEGHALEFVSLFKPYASLKFTYDQQAVQCNDLDVPYDDHLAEVTVPVLYIGAQGGYGSDGIYSTTLLGSSDVTILNVELHPDEQRFLDFGHVDIFTAGNAEALIWQPMLGWIEEHAPVHCDRRQAVNTTP